jgi:hypothetical protein
MNLIDEIALTKIQQVFAEKKYAFFTKGNYNLNIIGVRSPIKVANSFDDTMLVIYKKYDKWVIKEYPITTDAGLYWLEHPMNKKGTALLVPNQYRSTYKIDGHGTTRYEALCQRLASVEVYRDDNKDQILDFDDVTKEWGMFGINIHRSHPYHDRDTVDKYSAGCQVFQNIHDFKEFMTLCNTSSNLYGNSFTYTLLLESDLL